MALSDSTDFTLTRDQLITASMRMIGALATGESPTANETSDASVTLNMIVKNLVADGLQLWVTKQKSISLTADKVSYTLAPSGADVTMARPARVTEAFYRDSSGNDTPLTIISRNEYLGLSDKDSSGVPTSVFYDPLLTTGVLYVWPVIDSVTTEAIHITFQKPFDDLDAADNNFEFPQEWFRYLKYALALDLCPEYGVPAHIWDRIKSMEMELHRNLLGWDQEQASVFIGYDNSYEG